MARPTKLSAEVQNKIVAAVRIGASYENAARVAGITYRAFRYWMQRGEQADTGRFFQFFHAIKRAESESEVRWLAHIEKAANEGEWTAAAWKLERRWPDRWGRRQQIEQKVTGHVAFIEFSASAALAQIAAGSAADSQYTIDVQSDESGDGSTLGEDDPWPGA